MGFPDVAVLAGGLPAWTEGNLVRPLVHGASYFAELAAHGEVKGLEVPVRVYEDNVLYIEWWADLGDTRCDGIDTFIFDNDTGS